MQCTMQQQRALTTRKVARHAAFAPFRPATGRCLSVQVYAKKGKGRGALRQSAGVAGTPGQAPVMGPGGNMVMQQKPPVPEVDPENVEFVLFVRARDYLDGKLTIKEGAWLPLSIVKGQQAATFLVKQLETEWGRKLYGKLLMQQIGASVAKDQTKLVEMVKKTMPMYTSVPTKNFDYAFKIRDKSRPEAWMIAEDLTVLPPQSMANRTAFDSFKEFFSPDNLAKMFQPQ